MNERASHINPRSASRARLDDIAAAKQRGEELMATCPKCGAVLEVSLSVGTDYTKTQSILAGKATGSDLTNEQLNSITWKQSQKKPNLSTILVNQEALANPILKLLYERLFASANRSWKIAEILYKLSRTPEGTEFLQRWTPVRSQS